MKLEERPTYVHYAAVAKGCFGPSCHPEYKAGSGCGISTLGGHSLCGAMVCGRGVAAYLRAGFSLCLFIGSYEESYVMTGLLVTSGSHFLFCSPLPCHPWRQQVGLSGFGVWSHLRMLINKEWNERYKISVTYIEVLAKSFWFLKCSDVQP